MHFYMRFNAILTKNALNGAPIKRAIIWRNLPKIVRKSLLKSERFGTILPLIRNWELFEREWESKRQPLYRIDHIEKDELDCLDKFQESL